MTVIIPITTLTPGTVNGSDIYAAVDVNDQTQATAGTTKQYQMANLVTYMLSTFGVYTYMPCLASSTANLNATYNNGIFGIGATLTNAGSLSAFSLDGIAGVLNGRYLIKNQTSAFQNGIYDLITVGDNLTPWELTRSTDFSSSLSIINNGVVFIVSGNTNANTNWKDSFTGPVTVGTTDINYNQFMVTFS